MYDWFIRELMKLLFEETYILLFLINPLKVCIFNAISSLLNVLNYSCRCIDIDERSRANVQSLLDHPFIKPTISDNPDPPSVSSGESRVLGKTSGLLSPYKN